MDPRRRAKILDKVRNGRATRAEHLILKQEGLCFYCWTDLDKDVTKEHLDARANGGSNARSNLRVAHMPCNGIVGSLSVELKLELHETGRDQGPDAFWAKAREYQARYGNEKKAYTRSKGRVKPRMPHQLNNANVHPTREDTHQLTPEEATEELRKLELGGARVLTKAERLQLVECVAEQRELEGWPCQITYREFWRILERDGVPGLQARRLRAA